MRILHVLRHHWGRTWLHPLIADERGFIVSAELAVLMTVGTIGMVAGVSAVTGALVEEFADLANATQSLNQSFSTTSFNAIGVGRGGSGTKLKAQTTGSTFIDVGAGGGIGFGGATIGGGGAGAGGGGGALLTGGGAVLTSGTVTTSAVTTAVPTMGVLVAAPTTALVAATNTAAETTAAATNQAATICLTPEQLQAIVTEVSKGQGATGNRPVIVICNPSSVVNPSENPTSPVPGKLPVLTPQKSK